jgi:hypothetical protein
MEDVARTVIGEFRARAYLTRRLDHTSPIHTGYIVTILPCYIPRAVASSDARCGTLARSLLGLVLIKEFMASLEFLGQLDPCPGELGEIFPSLWN